MKKIARRALLGLFKLNLNLRLYAISSFVLWVYLRIIAGNSPGQRCLYGKKTIFQSDMVVITERLGLSSIAIDRFYLRAIVNHFFERESNFHLPTENRLSPKMGNKLNFQEYCASFFWPILKRLRVTTWVSCDFIYYYERPFQEQCDAQGIRSVVLMKECYKSPAAHSAWLHYLVKNFSDGIPASRVGVANRKMKEVLVSGGLLRSEAIEVIGSPRLEALATTVGSRRSSSSATAPALAIFFELGVKSGLPRFGVKSEVHEVLESLKLSMSDYKQISAFWEEVQRKILYDSLTFARQNPSATVIYKQKTGATMPKLPDGAVSLQNWKRIVGGDNTELLKAARLCVGFNTSAILEAIFSNLPVFSPPIVGLPDYDLSPFLLDYGHGVQQYADVADLQPYLKLQHRSFALESVYDSLASARDDGAMSAKVSWPGIQRVLGT